MNDKKTFLYKSIKDVFGMSDDTETCCIRVSGEDAADFLQGQLSNDIQTINNQTYQISSFSTHQGKVISIIRILKQENDFLILINRSVAEYFIAKVSMYILTSKVKIIIENNFRVFGVLEDNSKKILKDLKIEQQYKLIKLDNPGLWVLNNSTNQYKSLIFMSDNDDSISIELLSKKFNLRKSNKNVLKLMDILNCYLRLNDDNKEKYIPQVLNVEKLNGISFKKGCYTGQEIVARTHYLGKVKKGLFPVIAKGISLKIGDKIYNQDNESAGEVISDNISINNFFYSLAVIKIDSLNENLFSKDVPLTLID